jgi:adenylosuccinate synthase
LNFDKLQKAIKISGTTKLIINKCDILDQLNIFKLRFDNIKDGPNFIKFDNFDNMKEYIKNQLKDYCEVIFSGNKEFL